MDQQQLSTLALWIAGGAFAFSILLGLTGRIVVYYDRSDFFQSNAPVFILGLVYFIASTLHKQEHAPKTPIEIGIIAVGWVAAAWFVLLSFRNAIRYNQSFVGGLVVGILKFAIMLVAAIWAVLSLYTLIDERPKGLFGLLVLVFVGWVMVALVNGSKVEERRALAKAQ